MTLEQSILAVLSAVSLVLPVAESLVKRTANQTDDRIVRYIGLALALIPRIRFGSR
jgi:hypothetical protein